MYRLIITDKAVSDIVHAKEWYNKQQENLGGRFANVIFDSIDNIKRHPLAYPNKYRFTREMYVQKFPYVIIFSMEENVIFILRVFACKQDYKKKYKNL
ncbi:MAG: type II toxin-antitoxin system RelE/ParE family toxin [Bacteroidetes bacterium]|nr:type II toxin-antitoxin system RelE/ParE family toxin [Bacteroidota bacterium]